MTAQTTDRAARSVGERTRAVPASMRACKARRGQRAHGSVIVRLSPVWSEPLAGRCARMAESETAGACARRPAVIDYFRAQA